MSEQGRSLSLQSASKVARAGLVPGWRSSGGTMCRGCWSAACLYLVTACGPAAPAREPDSAAPVEASPNPGSPDEASTAPANTGDADSSAAASPAAVGSGGAIALDGSDDLDADIAALSSATKPAEPKPSELAGREVVYRVTPQGLVIEVGGIHLRPVAKAFRDARGSYGVDLQLTAESFDDRQYWVSKPQEGPLSIAGRIEGPAGKRQRFADERHGNDEEVVRSGAPRQFKQRWPGKGQPKLRAGETLTLEVGLWGVHADGERERPVRRLFEVKLVGAQPPQAVVSPPTLDWGS